MVNNVGLFLSGFQLLGAVVVLWVVVISPEIEAMKKVVAVIDYIDTHKNEFIRVDNTLWNADLSTGWVSFDHKMLSVEGDGRVFVSYSKNNYGSTKIKGIRERASLLINSFPNEKSYTGKSI